ncbi:PKD domain-containing protein [Neotamlana laminarinivorans]|uniref:PKD domain-containing protein n=1 Tax=Neotamlana laminarinivorans TaxID=2883124 RepID=A0A9X1HZN4_9FLAO|nr:PKD domain-containing protein [Tamlana laminarinivorans]MCB4798275.1 PKD domain-containing protein [Tamlana laminarinivorans]
MKTFKYILNIGLLFALIFACTNEEFGSTDFANSAKAPENVAAQFTVTQDNTGLVTITPTAIGASWFDVDFGDNSGTESVNNGENTTHTYAEGTYTVSLTAYNTTGLKTTSTHQLEVSFNAPENLEVIIENDAATSKLVNVTATADYAVSYDVYFGEVDDETPITVNIGESTSYQYQDAGTYTITVVAMGAAIETTTYTEEFVVTAILQPLASAPTPPSRNTEDVISIFSDAYTNVADTDYFPDWGQAGQGSSWSSFDLNGDNMLQYINLSYQGIQFGSSQNVSNMEYLHLDVWTTDVNQLETSLINIPADGSGSTEAPIISDLVANEWVSIDIPISDYTDQGLTVSEILQLKFVGIDWAAGTVFIDNIYFYKSPSIASTGIIGTWRLASEAGALGVGPSSGDISWWNCDDACVTSRACYYDDEYIFNADGSFQNILGSETWVEAWQGGSDACGTPVYPHDGSNAATYTYDSASGTVTLNGLGAFLGLPKAYNSGEISNPADAPSTVTYNVTLANNDTEMYVEIESGSGVFWQYKFVKDSATVSPLAGTWQIANEAGALGVGPAVGDITWWNCDDACVTSRSCYYDDTYVFGTDGSFQNVLGSETWVEAWQGGSDACGTPVYPHDGTNAATYTYDSVNGTLTLDGLGAYIGLAKAYNSGEIANPADTPSSVIYNISFIDSSTINVYIESGSGVFWQYKLVKI